MTRVSVVGSFVQTRYGAEQYLYFVGALRRAQMKGVERLEDLPKRVQKFVLEFEEQKKANTVKNPPRRGSRAYAN
jgi:hypothetical protein